MTSKFIRLYLFISVIYLAASPVCNGQKIVTHKVVMRTTGSTILHDNKSVVIYGFAESLFQTITLPSRTLYANEGDSVIISALNMSREPHTIHLHGLDVDTRNDGDPMTSFYIDHQQDTTYSFRAKHAGTYIYHCHFQDVMHLQMGMYGLLIIKAADGEKKAWTGGPAYTKEYAYLTSELDKFWHDTYEGGHTNYTTHPKYKPGYFLINGKSKQQLLDTSITITGKIGDKIYVRLANIGFYNNNFIFPREFAATVIDSDGRPLPKPLRKDTVEVMPGERYGVMLTPTTEESGNVRVQYSNMNTYQVEGVENIAYVISNTLAVERPTYQENLFTLFPNPAKDNVKISCQDMEALKELVIINSLGNEVERIDLRSASGNEFILGTRNFPMGIYCLRATTQSSVSQKTFVISR